MLLYALSEIDVWQIFLATVVGMYLAYEGGAALGRWRKKSVPGLNDSSFGSMIGAVLGLLAFVLAFTFGLAANRFETRRAIVVEETNAIGTTYLRSQYLEEPYRSDFKKLLKEYLQTRIDALDPAQTLSAIAHAEEIQNSLWNKTVEFARATPQSIPVGLFIQSLNQMIDIHTSRVVTALRTHLPGIIWEALYLIAIFALFILGFQAGVLNGRSLWVTFSVIFSFAIVMMSIADLDKSQQGFLRVSQETIYELMKKMDQ